MKPNCVIDRVDSIADMAITGIKMGSASETACICSVRATAASCHELSCTSRAICLTDATASLASVQAAFKDCTCSWDA